MALVNNIKVPEAWHNKKVAGKDWLYGFRQRNPQLSLRQTESTSLARATAFNPHNIEIFLQIWKQPFLLIICVVDKFTI